MHHHLALNSRCMLLNNKLVDRCRGNLDNNHRLMGHLIMLEVERSGQVGLCLNRLVKHKHSSNRRGRLVNLLLLRLKFRNRSIVSRLILEWY